MFYTYLYTDPKTDTPIYVGKGRGKRVNAHFTIKSKLGNVLRKRNKEGYIVQPVITYYPSENAAFAAEIFWIAVYGRANLGKGTLFNLTDGGDGCSGVIYSEDRKKKISENLRNRSPEVRDKIGASIKGIKRSTSTLAKMSASGKGRIFSEEHILKLKNRKFSNEHKDNISKSMVGRILSEEAKIQMSLTAAIKRMKKRGCADVAIT